LGINIDATVVVLLEKENLAKDRFYFLTEPNLKKRKYYIQMRKNFLQKQLERTYGNERKRFVKELKNINESYAKISNEASHKIAKRISAIASEYLELGYDVHIAIGRLTGLKRSISVGDKKSRKFREKINKFPYQKLTDYIHYKCQEVGVKKSNIKNIREKWTSKTCHKCDSRNTVRRTQASFQCRDCGLQYNADANGAINIGLRYWIKFACSSCSSLNTSTKKMGEINCSECKQTIPYKRNFEKNSEIVKLIFLQRKSKDKGLSQWLNHQGTSDSPSCDESAGTFVHLKVEDVRKENSL